MLRFQLLLDSCGGRATFLVDVSINMCEQRLLIIHIYIYIYIYMYVVTKKQFSEDKVLNIVNVEL